MSSSNSSNGQPTYEPITGLEGRKLLVKDVTEKINKLPLMNAGNAFHRFHAVWSLVVSAYPADCPVPTAEYEVARSAPAYDENLHYKENETKAEDLEKYLYLLGLSGKILCDLYAVYSF